MQSRKCSICNQIKPAAEFYVSGKYLYSHCKVCKREKDKNTYHKNRAEKERKRRDNDRTRPIRRLKAKLFVYGILSKSQCIDCSESRLEVLDFDHVSGIKTRSICDMISKGLKPSAIEEEISKCEIRCANCHRIKTFKQFGWARSDWNSREAEQQLAEMICQAEKEVAESFAKSSGKPRAKKKVGKH